ncbi:MAG: SUMF1/EgtB/PvdO family nonheme iron enzyme [bacterium]|nr:SUMF1/EgtB/PvdO family nonheme iron enzyme [Candidatus Minthenecus merdequi]
MIKETKYDVFISYSRKDYVDVDGNVIEGNIITRITDFLTANKISHWIDKEGIYSGAQFAELITDAISESKILLFISSLNSNESDYTPGEIKEAIDEHKLVIPFLVDDTPYNKRFRILVNCFDYIDYYTKPDAAFYSLLKAIKEGLEEYDNKLKDEEARLAKLKREEEKRLVLQNIAERERSYVLHEAEATKICNEIIQMKMQIGESERTCPICGNKGPITDRFCLKCGWRFYPAYALTGKYDERMLAVAKNNWKNFNGWSDMYSRHVNDSNERQKKNDVLVSQLTLEKERLEREVTSLQSEIQELKSHPVAVQDEPKKSENSDEKIRSFTVGDVTFKMVRVNKGMFWMGASKDDTEAYIDERPIHKVQITKDYYLGEVQVTQALWKAVMGHNPSTFKGADRPVENVSWIQCMHFVDKLKIKTSINFRLPTEAEWEYAARCGDADSFKYSGDENLDEVAWFFSNSNNETHNVRQKKPNSFGLYDMTGNVSEWCNDWKGDYTENEEIDPKGPKEGSFKVFRGGSWYDFGMRCRVSYRGNAATSRSSRDVGLRLALSVE